MRHAHIWHYHKLRGVDDDDLKRYEIVSRAVGRISIALPLRPVSNNIPKAKFGANRSGLQWQCNCQFFLVAF